MAEVPSTRTLVLASSIPHFALPDPEGRVFSHLDVRGDAGLVVAFLCNHCPYVIHLAKELGAFAAECALENVGFVAINSNDASRYPADSPAKMKDMTAAGGWAFPYLVDEDQSAARAFYAACTPDFYVFDSNLRLTYCGQFDASRPKNGKPVTGADLRLAVKLLIDGHPPMEVQKPSAGCNIKWKPGNEPSWFAV